MATQEHSTLLTSGLLKDVEDIVVEAYRRSHPDAPPSAVYRWLRYEDPRPVERLAEGVSRMRMSGRVDGGAVDKAIAKALKLGYLN
jgi:hypothetical protein